MNTNDTIKNTVLEKLAKAWKDERTTEIWKKGTSHTLETEYRLSILENGNALYTISQSYKEHYPYQICGCGQSWRFRNKTTTWEQEEGQHASTCRCTELITERNPLDPNGPWEVKHLAHKEAETQSEMPTIQKADPQAGWQKASGLRELDHLLKRNGLLLKHNLLRVLKTINEHTRQ